MSPRWATVAGHHLYFYAQERHRRPHVDVRGPDGNASIDISTGEVLAGELPPRVIRAVRQLIEAHRVEAQAAFQAALERRPFDTLGSEETSDE